MAKPAILIVIVLAIVWAVLWGKNTPNKMTNEVKPDEISEVREVEPIMVTLLEQNKSGENGIVEITSMESKTKVVLRITNNVSILAQPAHIHVGMCPTPGGVKYPLKDVIDGISETILDVPLSKLMMEDELAINVHKSINESATYVSCGDVPK